MPVRDLEIAPGPYTGTDLGWLPTRPGLHGAGRLAVLLCRPGVKKGFLVFRVMAVRD